MTRAARAGFPVRKPAPPPDGTPRVVVTGCYDWLHSGHIRFFMDAAEYGALYAVVGSDRNVELLKGPGHPLQHEEERRYMVGAVRSVHQLPRLVRLRLDGRRARDRRRSGATHYVVNEDGDQPEKRDFCRTHGIEYVVLERVPHAGLPARSSTDLRGFYGPGPSRPAARCWTAIGPGVASVTSTSAATGARNQACRPSTTSPSARASRR